MGSVQPLKPLKATHTIMQHVGQTGPEDSHGGCGSDVFGQTVPGNTTVSIQVYTNKPTGYLQSCINLYYSVVLHGSSKCSTTAIRENILMQ